MNIQEPASFRDRTAQVFHREGQIYRQLNDVAQEHWKYLQQTEFFEQFTANGKLIQTEEVSKDELHHAKVPMVSYPYEWTFNMLKDAALLTLELMEAALTEDMILKDGTSYNVQWQGSQPVFIDIPSLVRFEPGQLWMGYGQFCQLFLFPLLMQAHKNIPFQPWLRGCLDGISVHECRSMMSLRDLFRRGVFRHVFLHALLQPKRPQSTAQLKRNMKTAGFHKLLIEANVRGLRRILSKLNWKEASSRWSEYEHTWTYTSEEVQEKEAFLDSVLTLRHWKQIWDLGCNVGRYSRQAAEHADYVLAMDSDALSIDSLYQRLKQDGIMNVLPLVINVADASPAQGWRGLERRTLAERGRPELVLCLALIHHLVISAQLPMEEVLEWLGQLTDYLVIEFPTTADPMVQSLLQSRDEPVPDYHLEWFENCLQKSFHIVARQSLEHETRILYFAENRQ